MIVLKVVGIFLGIIDTIETNCQIVVAKIKSICSEIFPKKANLEKYEDRNAILDLREDMWGYDVFQPCDKADHKWCLSNEQVYPFQRAIFALNKYVFANLVQATHISGMEKNRLDIFLCRNSKQTFFCYCHFSEAFLSSCLRSHSQSMEPKDLSSRS